MNKKNMWTFKFTAPELLLLPAAIGVNYIGKLLTHLLNLPLWLDSIGTFSACMLGGPIIGALSGLINNMLYGFLLDSISFVYGLTSIVMGLVVGVLSVKGFLSDWRKVFLMGVFAAAAAAIVSTPINVAFWEGANGNIWGDMLFDTLKQNISAVWAASFLAELAVDLPDKIITVFISYAIYKNLPKYIIQFYT